MIKIVTLLLTLALLSGESEGQYVNIPDNNFRNYIRLLYPACFNEAGQMDTTCEGILNCDSLNIIGSYNYQYNTYDPDQTILNTSGLVYFKNLRKLYINSTSISNLPDLPERLEFFSFTGGSATLSLPYLPNSLKAFQIKSSPLTLFPQLPEGLQKLEVINLPVLSFLPLLPSALDTFIFSNMKFTSLPALPTGIRYMVCNNDSLTSLPALPGNLNYLNCDGSLALTSLPILPEGLRELYTDNRWGWDHGSLSYIPNFPAELRIFKCGTNLLNSLPALPPKLHTLIIWSNPLQTLPPLPDSLETLSLYGNQLTSIPALPVKLKTLYVAWNQITHLPLLNDSLMNLDCKGNLLTALPVLPQGIKEVRCSDNRLTTLPSLPPGITNLDCENNFLTVLPSLPVSLGSLNVQHNQIYCLPRIPTRPPGNWLIVRFDGDKISCIPNMPGNLELHSTLDYYAVLPLCNPANNNNHCQSSPIISGKIFYDNNSNGIKDASENYKSNAKFELSNGSFAYSNNNGYFETAADSIGAYTITPLAPNFYNVVPSSTTYNFTSYDTIVSKEYALQANSIQDSLAIKVTPLNWAARPGFSFPYLISYENAGTTALSPNIIFNYDDAKLMYDSGSNTSVVNNGNNLLLSAGSFVPGQRGNFTAYFKVRTTVTLGDSLFAKATINSNANIAADSNKIFIRGSFDPNDKQATPELSPLQVFKGTYIDYTIRFQNTGTDTAFSIVISDTLNEGLQTNTLQVTASSHTCKATVKGNTVFFEFLNILLPDSNVNELKSHGFVSFRVKPQPAVGAGTTIPNNAAIYFDYNAPVITNTAGTFIRPFTVVPVKLISFSAVPQNDNTVSLFWNTANEINTKQFVIEQSGDGIKFNAVTVVTANGKANNNYNATITDYTKDIIYYRLKIVDNDGRFTYSPVLKTDRRKNTAGITVLTNPAKDFIIINTTGRSLNSTQCSIINTQGAVVKSFTVIQGSQTIDIKVLPGGVYYLRTANGSSRFLVQ